MNEWAAPEDTGQSVSPVETRRAIITVLRHIYLEAAVAVCYVRLIEVFNSTSDFWVNSLLGSCLNGALVYVSGRFTMHE